MDVPESGLHRWAAIVLSLIVSFAFFLGVALWQRYVPAKPSDPKADSPAAVAPAGATPPPAARDCLFPGSGTDYFDECPDPEGYYSSRRHFDLGSSNRVRRALVLLEKDEDRTLHLRLSKADLDEMPTVDEVLPLVEVSPEESAEILERIHRGADVLRPRFEDSRSGGELALDRVWVLTPPVAGFELRAKGGDNYEPPELWSVDLRSGKVLWSEALDFNNDIEFSASRPSTFFLFSGAEGLKLFDLREGRLCATQEPSSRVGWSPRRPFYLGNGTDLQYVEGETIWRIDLSNCQRRAVGSIVLPAKALSRFASVDRVETSRDGSVLAATIVERFTGVNLLRDPSPVRRLYVWLAYDGNRYVEGRRVVVRAHNALHGLETDFWESMRQPLLLGTFIRHRNLNPTRGAAIREDPTGEMSHILIRNREGNFYALRTPSKQGAGLDLDPNRGLLRYAGKWWDLKVLDRPFESDLG